MMAAAVVPGSAAFHALSCADAPLVIVGEG